MARLLRKSIVLVTAVIFGTALSICLPTAPRSSFAAVNPVINEYVRAALPGNVHPEARPEYDIGRTDPSLPMERIILLLKLTPEKQAERDRFLSEQLDSSSPNFHHWLTPEEYGERFGQSPENIAIVEEWLISHGFTIDEVAKGRNWINFSGPVAAVESAFQTQIHDYLVNGRLHHANSTDPSIPAALSGVVAGPVSLHNFTSKPMHTAPRPIPEATSQPEYNDPNYGSHELAPGDFAVIYNVNGAYDLGYDGTGVTIAIVGRTNPPSNIARWADFRSKWGLPHNSPNVIVNGADPGNADQGDDVESDLDVEWSGAVANGATIDFVTSATTNSSDGVNLSAQYVVNNNLAPVLSMSYGLDEASMGNENSFYNTVWAQAAALGITVFVSSGDDGAYTDIIVGGSTLSVSGIASTPNNIAVGGTNFDSSGNYWSSSNASDGTSALSYIPETAWNDGCPSGSCWASGGGASSIYGKPAWQVSPGVPQDGKRDLPDVALDADPDHVGYEVLTCFDRNCTSSSWSIIGGTSAGAPSFAGIMALIVQSTGGVRQGNANTLFYKLAKAQYSQQAGASAVFHDITSGNNSFPGYPTGYSCGVGYDQVTGLGSVDAAKLLQAFPSAHFTVTAPSSAAAGKQFNFTVKALDANGNADPGYSGTVRFTSTDGAATLPANYTFVAGDSGAKTFSATLNTPGSQTITATDTVNGSITGKSNAISVSSPPATHFTVSAPSSATAGSSFSITVTALDANNHTVTGYSGTVHFTSTDTAAVLPANTKLTNGTGTFQATLKTAGSRTITATDTVTASITGTSAAITVAAPAATHLKVSAPSSATAGTAFSFTVTAQDANNNTVTGYSGTVHFTSTDGAAMLPANYTFVAADSGTKTFSATLNTPGSQTITATDTVNASITGKSNAITATAGPPTVDKPTVSAITTAGATLGATIESTGGQPVTSAGVAYGTSANPTAPGITTSTTQTGTPFTVNVTGLASNTLYHFRGYAANSTGLTGYTADTTFTTVPGAPKATSATGITAAGFTANWTPPSGTGAITGYRLDVATDTAFSLFLPGYKDLAVSGTSAAVTGVTSGKTYYYRVRAVNDGGTGANSNSEKVLFVPLSTIALTSPASGQTWPAGLKYPIAWTYTGNPGPVRIVLLKGGTKVSTIISSTPVGSNGNGSYSWTIPKIEASGSDYQIKVVSTVVSSCSTTSGNFTIAAPTVSITSPARGQTLPAGLKYPIAWTYTGNPGPVRIVLLKGDVKVLTIISSTPVGSNGNGSYSSWTIPKIEASGSDYQIKVVSTVVSSCSTTSGNFTIAAPTVSVISPASGQIWPAGGKLPIAWTYTGNPGPVKIVLLKSGLKVLTIISSTPVGLNGTGAYSWTIPKKRPSGTDYAVKITSIANGLISGVSSLFTISGITVSAGPDQKVSGLSPVKLIGSNSSDFSKGGVSYLWTQLDGPPVTLVNPRAVETGFVAPQAGSEGKSLRFQLTVTETGGVKSKDNCIVNVVQDDAPPTAEAGPNQAVAGFQIVELDGSGSSALDAGILSYSWRQISGVPVALSEPFCGTNNFRCAGRGYRR